MFVLDEELAYLLKKVRDLCKYSVSQQVLEYVLSGRYLEWSPSGKRGGFSDEEVKKWLRSILAKRVKDKKNIIFEGHCPKCGDHWLQNARPAGMDHTVCPTCHAEIRDPEILAGIPNEEDLLLSLDELTEEQKSHMPEKLKEMIAYNEGSRYGNAEGTFNEKKKWQKGYYDDEKKYGWERERTVEVPISEAEIIKKLREERGLSDNEVLVVVPKLRSIKSSEEKLLVVLFGMQDGALLTQLQLANILQVTQPRVSQLLKKYKGKLVQSTTIENPEGGPKRKRLQGYYMPRKAKEKLAKTILPANIILRHVLPLAEKHPQLPWRKGIAFRLKNARKQ